MFEVELADLVFPQIGGPFHARRRNGRAADAIIDEFLHARALHGHGGIIVRRIGELQFAALRKFCGLGLQPRHVRFNPRGVDDEQIHLVGKPVGVEVVNDAAAFVAHQGVLALAGREFADVVGQSVIQEIGRRPRR